MSRLRVVQVGPPGGWPDMDWADDAVTDAFVRAANSVGELYSAALLQHRLEGPTWLLQIVGHHDPARDDVGVVAHVDPRTAGELAGFQLPTVVGALGPFARAALALEVVHGAMSRLAVDRGWEPAVLDDCYRRVHEAGFVYACDTAWKSSPDRRHRARARYRLSPATGDGFGRVVLEVENRRDEAMVTSPAAISDYTSARFKKRVAPSLTWESNAVVSIEPTALHQRRPRLAMSHDETAWHSEVVDPAAPLLARFAPAQEGPEPGTRLPAVSVRGHGVNAPESRPWMSGGGGGPVNGVPAGWMDELDRQLNTFFSEPGQDWWQDSGRRELYVGWYAGAELERPRVRVGSHASRVTVTIERPVDQMSDPSPEEVARADVTAMVAAVRRRTGLGPHPLTAG